MAYKPFSNKYSFGAASQLPDYSQEDVGKPPDLDDNGQPVGTTTDAGKPPDLDDYGKPITFEEINIAPPKEAPKEHFIGPRAGPSFGETVGGLFSDMDSTRELKRLGGNIATNVPKGLKDIQDIANYQITYPGDKAREFAGKIDTGLKSEELQPTWGGGFSDVVKSGIQSVGQGISTQIKGQAKVSDMFLTPGNIAATGLGLGAARAAYAGMIPEATALAAGAKIADIPGTVSSAQTMLDPEQPWLNRGLGALGTVAGTLGLVAPFPKARVPYVDAPRPHPAGGSLFEGAIPGGAKNVSPGGYSGGPYGGYGGYDRRLLGTGQKLLGPGGIDSGSVGPIVGGGSPTPSNPTLGGAGNWFDQPVDMGQAAPGRTAEGFGEILDQVEMGGVNKPQPAPRPHPAARVATAEADAYTDLRQAEFDALSGQGGPLQTVEQPPPLPGGIPGQIVPEAPPITPNTPRSTGWSEGTSSFQFPIMHGGETPEERAAIQERVAGSLTPEQQATAAGGMEQRDIFNRPMNRAVRQEDNPFAAFEAQRQSMPREGAATIPSPEVLPPEVELDEFGYPKNEDIPPEAVEEIKRAIQFKERGMYGPDETEYQEATDEAQGIIPGQVVKPQPTPPPGLEQAYQDIIQNVPDTPERMWETERARRDILRAHTRSEKKRMPPASPQFAEAVSGDVMLSDDQVDKIMRTSGLVADPTLSRAEGATNRYLSGHGGDPQEYFSDALEHLTKVKAGGFKNFSQAELDKYDELVNALDRDRPGAPSIASLRRGVSDDVIDIEPQFSEEGYDPHAEEIETLPAKGPEYHQSMMKRVGTGKPGFAVESPKSREWTPQGIKETPVKGEHNLVYRDEQGNPVAMANVIKTPEGFRVTDLSIDKALKGKAAPARAIAEELIRMDALQPYGGMTPDSKAAMAKLQKIASRIKGRQFADKVSPSNNIFEAEFGPKAKTNITTGDDIDFTTDEPQFSKDDDTLNVGYDDDLGEVLAGSLYEGKAAKIVSRELGANSLDAIRHLGEDGRLVFGIDKKTNSIIVIDNGVGMSKQEIKTVFTQLGKSGKRDDPDAIGGFGIAKAAPLLGGERSKTITYHRGEDGKVYRTAFGGTPAELTDTSKPVPIEHSAATQEQLDSFKGIGETGTTVHVQLNKGEDLSWAETIPRLIAAYSKYKAEIYMQHSNGTLERLERGRDAGVWTDAGTYETDNFDVKIEIPPPAPGTVNSSNITAVVLNNGMYQFHKTLEVRGKPKDMFNVLVLDIKSKVKEKSKQYPFTLSREDLRGDAYDTLLEIVKKNVVDDALAKRRIELKKLYNNMRYVDYGYGPLYYYDTGSKFTEQEYRRLIKAPVLQQLGGVAREAINTVMFKMDEFLDSKGMRPWSGRWDRTGIIFDEGLKGIWIPNPGEDKVAVMINFLQMMSGRTPDQASASIAHCILHEIAHFGDAQQSHGDEFVVWFAEVAEKFGRRNESRLAEEIESIIAPDGNYTPEIQKLLQIYTTGRGRTATKGDALTRTGVESRPKSGGGGVDEPGNRPDGGGTPELETIFVRVNSPRDIKKVMQEGYKYSGDVDAAGRWKFTRKGGPKKTEFPVLEEEVGTAHPTPNQARIQTDLQGAQPRFNIGGTSYIPKFESDIDKALFIIAQANKSARDKDYLNFVMKQTNMNEVQARKMGQEIRRMIKDIVSGREAGEVNIPVLNTKIDRTKLFTDYEPSAGGAGGGGKPPPNRPSREYIGPDPPGAGGGRRPPNVRSREYIGPEPKQGAGGGGSGPPRPPGPPGRGSTPPGEPPTPPPDMTVDPGDIGTPVNTRGKTWRELYNLSRSISASWDFSAPLRQGIGLIHKKAFWKALPDMFRAWRSEAGFQAIQDSISAKHMFKPRKLPNGKYGPSIAEEAGLKLGDLLDFSKREEQFMSQWAETGGSIPYFSKAYASTMGAGVRASNRAYTGFLNKVRSEVFESLMNDAKVLGVPGEANLPVSRALAEFVNVATGRGSLGKLEPAAAVLNGAFFSPRLMAARLKMLNPATYIMGPPQVRKEYLKSLLAIAAFGNTVLQLGKMAGFEVGTDPASSDFGKLIIGKTRLDPWGGFQQYIVAANRLLRPSGAAISNNIKTGIAPVDLAAGFAGRGGQIIKSTQEPLGGGEPKEYDLWNEKPGPYDPTHMSVLSRFGWGKTHPVVNFGLAILNARRELSGEKLNFGTLNPMENAVSKRFIPIIAQDVVELWQENPALVPVLGVPAAFGAGVQSYRKEYR